MARAKTQPLMFFADGLDAGLVLEHFNADPDVAYLVKAGASAGGSQWRAVGRIERLESQSYRLWHHPSGTFPLATGDYTRHPPPVPDPWAGWTDATSATRTAPDSGMYHWSTLDLNLRLDHVGRVHDGTSERTVVRMQHSVVSWEGNYSGPAGPGVTAYWKGLRGWFDAEAAVIRTGSRSVRFHAFPTALDRLRHDTPYYANGFDLHDGISAALSSGTS